MFGWWNPLSYLLYSGTYCNPFLYGGLNSPAFPSNRTTAYAASQYQEAATNYALGPYGWASDWGGTIRLNTFDSSLPLSTVMNLQMMMINPYYNPASSITYTGSSSNTGDVVQNATAEARREALKIKYGVLQKFLPILSTEIDKLLKTDELTDEEKRKLTALKQRVEDLKKKMEEMAETSADKKVTDALEEVEAMQGEYYKIKEEATAIAKEIASSAAETAEEEGNPVEEEEDSSVVDSGGEDVVQVDELKEGDLVSRISSVRNVTAEDIKSMYDDDLSPAISNLLENERTYIHASDKELLEKKAEELKKAIEANKPVDELKEKYNELCDLVNEVYKKVGIKKNFEVLSEDIDSVNKNENISESRKAEIKDKYEELEKAIQDNKSFDELKGIYNDMKNLIDDANNKVKLMKDYKALIKNIDENIKALEKQGYDISSEDKEAIKKKKQEIDTAFETKTPEEVEELIAELDELVQEAIVRALDKPFEDAADICKNIAAAAEGIDWGSSQEKVIKEEVSKINSKNVVAVFDHWSQNDYNKKTGDKKGIMETIFGEFKAQPKKKRELAQHILDALKEAAKEQGKTEKIASYVAVIEGQIKNTGLFHTWDYEKIYNAFNAIHAALGNPKTEGDDQQQSEQAAA